MDIKFIEKEFKKKVSDQISIEAEGINRYRIFSPFLYNDGDHFSIVLKTTPKGWILTDEGNTYMHLSYYLDVNDLDRGTREKIIRSTLSCFGVNEKDGALVSEIKDNDFGNAFYSYIQSLIKISDVTYLSREMVKSTFMEDFEIFISEKVPPKRLEFNYFDKAHDPEGKYIVDCRINSMPNSAFIFAISNDDKCRDATINLHQFEKWGLNFRSIAIFEEQEGINRKVLARFSDVSEKQFSSLTLNKDRISSYLTQILQ